MPEPTPEADAEQTRDDCLRAARPFDQTVVQSPWFPVTDAPLYLPAKEHLERLVTGCGRAGNESRCATVVAPPGYGKTHLLACLREALERTGQGLFVYVTPVLASGLPLERHLVRATFDSLFFHSDRQREKLARAIRLRLLTCYDESLATRALGLQDLGISQTLLGLFNRRYHYLKNRSAQQQDEALVKALSQRRFLDHAFHRFEKEHPPTGNAVRADRETFVAACSLVCGNEPQQARATAWFQGSALPPEGEGQILQAPCEGEEKTRNSLFTLQRLAAEPLCFALDQLEDSFRSFSEIGKLTTFWDRLGWLVNGLGTLPGMALVFAFEQNIWEGKFRTDVPRFLLSRLISDGGELRLSQLRDESARKLVQARLEACVWSRHPELRPADPLYPFTAGEISQLRREADGELRDFLNRARALYLSKLYPVPRVLDITPNEGDVLAPTRVILRGTHLPRDVRILFNDRRAVSVTTTPDGDEIHATTPTGLEGVCRVVVLDNATGETIAGELAFTFHTQPALPRPLHQHVDRSRMRAIRTERGLRQADVGTAIGSNGGWVGKFERGEWNPEDDFIEKLAALYGVPVEQLLQKDEA